MWRILGAVILTGCVAAADGPSPTEPHDQVTTTTAAPTTTQQAGNGIELFRECMADAGFPVPPPPMDGRGRPRMAMVLDSLTLDDPDVGFALESCSHFLQTGSLDLGNDPRLRSLVLIELGELADCIREMGVADFPRPSPEFDGRGFPYPNDRIPWSDPGLAVAAKTCLARLHAGGR